MRSRPWRSALSAAAAALYLATGGCDRPAAPGQPPSAGAQAKVFTLRFASPYPPNHPFSQADIAWMKHVEILSRGRLRIEPYWGGTLVTSDNTTLELAHGVADIALVTPIYSRAGMRAIKVQAGFYTGAETPDQQVAVYACLQKQFPVLDKEMAGVRVLAVQGGNLPEILTRGREVARLSDLRGLRLRTPSEFAPMLRQLGVDPVTMPMAGVYASLSKGVIDGVVAPADTLRSLHFNEVAKVFNRFSVPRGAYPARAISLQAWNRLPPDLQAVLAQGQRFWEDELSAKLKKSEADGLAFGHGQGERFVVPAPDQEAALLRLYDVAALQAAKAASTPDFDGPSMYAAAHAAIARIRAGQPAC